MVNRGWVITGGFNQNRVADGAIVDYIFLEGGGDTVTDITEANSLMDLTILDPANVTWVQNDPPIAGTDGLRIDTDTRIDLSGGLDSKITPACLLTNEITIEVWITPANTTQEGPARIVSMGPDPSGVGGTLHTFMMGQGKWPGASVPGSVRVRLRTSTTNDDGYPDGGEAANTPGGVLTTGLHHVCATFGSGLLTIYVDGVQQSQEAWTGDFSNWPDGGASPTYSFVLGNEFGTDRPWLGTYHRVTVHDRALTPAEITQNFAADPLGGGQLPAPLISFASPSDTVDENVGTVTAAVELSRPAPVGGIDFAVTPAGPPDTTMDSSEYTITSPNPVFGNIPEGSSSQEVSIVITDDGIAESTETLALDLSSATATLGVNPRFTLTVNDNDTEPTVQWTTDAQSASVDASQVTATLTLGRAYSGQVSVPLVLTGTATSGSEYTPPTSPVVFDAFETTKDVVIAISQVDPPEAGETIILDFGTITNGSAGATPTQTITFAAAASIPDLTPGDDGAGFVWDPPGGSGDRIPAATWTKSPKQHLFEGTQDEFVLGVMAGHYQGISEVRIRVNNADDAGRQVTLTETTLDTSTAYQTTFQTRGQWNYEGTEAYNVRLRASDFPDGEYVVRAHIVPVGASPARSIDWRFWSNRDGTLGRTVRWVSNSGGGDGTSSSSPTSSIRNAINGLSAAQAEGAIIYLMGAGQSYGLGGTSTQHNNARPITITHDPAVAQHAIRLRPRSVVSFEAVGPLNLVVDGLTRDNAGNNSWQDSRAGSGTLIERNMEISATSDVNRMFPSGHFQGDDTYGSSAVGWGYWIEGCRLRNCGDSGTGFIGHVLHSLQEGNGGSFLRGNPFVIGCAGWDGARTVPTNHPDVHQSASGWENAVITQNVSLKVEGQPVFFHGGNQKNIWMANNLIGHRQPGSHVWTVDPDNNGSGTATNIVIAFNGAPYHAGATINGASSPGSDFADNRFYGNICRSWGGSSGWVGGYGMVHSFTGDNENTNLTQGEFDAGSQYASDWVYSSNENAVWVNPRPDTYDFTPLSSGVLADKVPMDGSVPFVPKYDAYGRARGNGSGNTAIGPVRAQDETN